MSTDLQVQIRHYTASYMSEIPAVNVADIARALPKTSDVPRLVDPRKRRRPAWVYALAAVLVVLLFGWVAVLLRNSAEPIPPVTKPGPSSANGWIAISTQTFFTEPAGFVTGDIYVTREGEPPRRLIGTDDDGLGRLCPVFSPDGSKLAYFESDRDARTKNVVIGEFDGTFEPLVSFNPVGKLLGCFTWSPDSTRVAYIVGVGGADTGSIRTLAQLRASTIEGDETLLFEGIADRMSTNFDHEWSPDGSSIAITALRLPSSPPSGTELVSVVPLDGSGAGTVVEADMTLPSVAWSPDGSQLAMLGWAPRSIPRAGYSGPDLEPVVRIVGADGENHHEFVTGGMCDFDELAWSPDGSKLAWVDQSIHRVIVADLDGNDRVALATYRQGGETYFPTCSVKPIWSADGERILVPMGIYLGDPRVLVTLSLNPEIEPTMIAELPGIGWDGVSWQVD